uniref:Uncharacterized protein n=1 Tax=Eptatretus burgeri TaxID=7764 RepID=A0A8C4WVV6_EPTBU
IAGPPLCLQTPWLHACFFYSPEGENDAGALCCGVVRPAVNTASKMVMCCFYPHLGCVPGLVVDLVFVVDGSWSVSSSNFRLIQQFMQTMVQRLDVSPQAARIGAVQYGTDARIEFHLGKHRSTAEAAKAVGGMSYKGGNTMTGEALSLAFKTGFEGKAREGAARVVVLITDGKAQDEFTEPVQRLKENGVELFVLGIKAADEEELERIASLPVSDHIFVIPDFRNLAELEEDFSRRICASIARQMDLRPPTDLRFVNVGQNQLGLAWSPAPGPGLVSYRAFLRPTRPGSVPPKEHSLDPRTTETEFFGLDPETEYEAQVVAVYTAGETRTRVDFFLVLPMTEIGNPSAVVVSGGTPNSLRVEWTAAPGSVKAYRVRFSPVHSGGEYDEHVTASDETGLTLDGLRSNTQYQIQVQAMTIIVVTIMNQLMVSPSNPSVSPSNP